MSINKKIKRGLYGLAAMALSASTAISAFAPIAVAVDPDVLAFDSTCALSQSLETADFVCTLGATNYNMFIGVISSEGQDAGAFVRYGSEEELAKIVRENGHISFTDSDMVSASYIHVDGDDSGIMAMADGSAYRFSAGNVKLSDVINKTFGIAENDGTGADPSGEEHANPQSIVWEYGTGTKKISNGKLVLKQACEPKWAYDENAQEGEFMPCVDITGDIEEGPYVVHQGDEGGSLFVNHGIKLVFELQPDEGYEMTDLQFMTEPEDAQVQVVGGDNTFQMVMPENTAMRIVVVYKEIGTESIEVEECTDDACGESIPEIVSAESTDFPDNAAKIRVSDVDHEGEALDFEAGLYGATSEEVEEFVYGYFEEHEAEYEACDELEDEDEYEACVDEIYANLYDAALDKFGIIVAGMFDISLIDDSGNIVDYEGDGITITLTVTEDMIWWADFFAEHFDGEVEFKIAHLKHDGTIEFIPYVDNEDGTFTIKVTSLSPFAVGITRASSVVPPSPNTFDGVMTNLAVAFVSLAGIATISFIVRRKVRR